MNREEALDLESGEAYEYGHNIQVIPKDNVRKRIVEIFNHSDIVLNLQLEEIKRLRKERDYWKLSFNKKVEASRK